MFRLESGLGRCTEYGVLVYIIHIGWRELGEVGSTLIVRICMCSMRLIYSSIHSRMAILTILTILT